MPDQSQDECLPVVESEGNVPNALSPSRKKLRTRDGQRFQAVAQIYQQLKHNHDARLDYGAADEFHFGEMEMRRRAGNWLHRHVSLTSWYRYASKYGNSFLRPALLLILVLFIFGALYPLPIIDLRSTEHVWIETYTTAANGGGKVHHLMRWEAALFGKSLLVSTDSAMFQKNTTYTPADGLGRGLAITVSLLSSTLFGLFLLAIRRRFRR